MMSELHAALIDNFKANGLDCREIGFKDLIDKTINLDRPAVNITINEAKAQKVTLNTYKWVITVTINIIFGHLKGGSLGEARRKEGVYKLIEAITQYVMIQKFGLELENPLFPSRFRNITSYDLARAGFQIYALDFWGSFNTTYADPEDKDMGHLNSILNQYWLMPSDSTAFADGTNARGSDLLTVGP